MGQKPVEFFEICFWSKQGCLDYFLKKIGLIELTLLTHVLNLALSPVLRL